MLRKWSGRPFDVSFAVVPIGIFGAAVLGAIFGIWAHAMTALLRRHDHLGVVRFFRLLLTAGVTTFALISLNGVSAVESTTSTKTAVRFAFVLAPIAAASVLFLFGRRDDGSKRFGSRLFGVVLPIVCGLSAAAFDFAMLGRSDGLLRTHLAILAVSASAGVGAERGAAWGKRPPFIDVIGWSICVIGICGAGMLHVFDARDFLKSIDDSPTVFARSTGGLLSLWIRRGTDPVDENSAAVMHLGAEDPIPSADLDRLISRRREFNVVVVTWDTVRADHVGHLGYSRKTTPNLDRLAEESVTFSYAWAQYPSSRYSIESFLTSRFACRTSSFAADHRVEVAGLSSTFLASDLRAAGRRTVGLTALHPALLDRLFAYFPNGFDTFDRGIGDDPRDAKAITDRALQLLYELETTRPFHLWAHYFDPHDPFVAHEAFPFGETLVDRYDSEIAFSDAEIGRLIDGLRRRDDWDRTIVVVHADHGEEFFEHGGVHHGSTLYDEQIRVPLVVRVPGIAPRVVADSVGLVDVKPTILELLGLADGRGDDGSSLLREMLGLRRTIERPPTFAEIHEGSSLGVRADAVGDGKVKVIADRRTGIVRTFSIAVDPRETAPADFPHGEPRRLLTALSAFVALRGGRASPIDGLGSRDPTVRRAAFLQLESEDALESVDAALWKRLTVDPHESVRRVVLEYLLRDRTPRAFDALVEAVRAEKQPELKRHAIFGLAVGGDRRAIRFLRESGAIDPNDPMVLIARGMLGDGDATNPLQDLFFRLSGESRIAALSAGGAVGLAPAARMIRSLLCAEILPGHIEPAALEIASRSGDPSILPIYHERLVRTASRPAVWRSVMDASARFPVRDIVPILRRALASPSADVRQRARAKLESEGLLSLLPQLSALEEDLTAAENVVLVDRRYAEAADILRRGAEKAHELGLADWGLAIESWQRAVDADRRDIARRDASYWSQRFAWPDFARRLMGRLEKIAASTETASARLDWIASDASFHPGTPWFGAVALRCEKGILPTGGNLRDCGLRMIVTSSADPSVQVERSARIPLEGILEGETTEIALFVEMPTLRPGVYVVTVKLTAIGGDHCAPLRAEVTVP